MKIDRRGLLALATLPAFVDTADAADNDALRLAFTARSARPAAPIDKRYFGIHVHHLANHPDQRRPITPWPAVPFGSIRTWDSSLAWARVNPSPDQWEFTRFDRYVDIAQQHGATVLCTLGTTPPWAAARPDEPSSYGPGRASEPKSMSMWEKYVRTVVKRYRGRIEAYEIWNEPKLTEFSFDREWRGKGFYSGSVKPLVEMTRIARDVIRAEDPQALVVAPGFTNGPGRVKIFLEAGGAELIDVVAYHFYAKSAKEVIRQVHEVAEVMRTAGVGKLPLWNTESSLWALTHDARGQHFSPDRLADLLAQQLLIQAACGVERFYYHGWDNRDSGLIDASGRPVISAKAIEELQEWLIGSRAVSASTLGPQAVRLEFEKGGERSVVAWSESGGAFDLPAPAGWKMQSSERLLKRSAGSATGGSRTQVELDGTPLRLRSRRENER